MKFTAHCQMWECYSFTLWDKKGSIFHYNLRFGSSRGEQEWLTHTKRSPPSVVWFTVQTPCTQELAAHLLLLLRIILPNKMALEILFTWSLVPSTRLLRASGCIYSPALPLYIPNSLTQPHQWVLSAGGSALCPTGTPSLTTISPPPFLKP